VLVVVFLPGGLVEGVRRMASRLGRRGEQIRLAAPPTEAQSAR